METPSTGHTHRYDKMEDRMNDQKLHDNPNHPGIISHRRGLQSAEDALQAGLDEYYMGDDYLNYNPLPPHEE